MVLGEAIAGLMTSVGISSITSPFLTIDSTNFGFTMTPSLAIAL